MIGAERFVQLGGPVLAPEQEPGDEPQYPPHVGTEIPGPLDAIGGVLRRQRDRYRAQRGDDRGSQYSGPRRASQAETADRQTAGDGGGGGIGD
jgi:hypothetical protein